MAFDSAQERRIGGSWGTIAALAAADGSATHPMPRLLAAPYVAVRDLADSVHALCALHGRHPGVIDHALEHSGQSAAQDWLEEAAAAFTEERAYLAQLTAASGPLPSTPGQAESEAAISAQRHALDMLAQSDRTGCATGAAIALVLDWTSIRDTLDVAARRFGIEPSRSILPDGFETASLVSALADTPAIERAMAFGAQQLLAQHRGLWDLLEARASARNHQ
ncbi:hypothetical protein ABC974_19000 [Sphingomonas oligophenolica]|uniref:Uncharacterized protein n=1 Tax=Sphingomonas oligophenolica TaxID=301154 RepID=A0ABU9Y7D5_9SPHN